MKAFDFLEFVEVNGISNNAYRCIRIDENSYGSIYDVLREEFGVKYIYPSAPIFSLTFLPNKHEDYANYVVYYSSSPSCDTISEDFDDLELLRRLRSAAHRDLYDPEGEESLAYVPLICTDGELNQVLWVIRLY